MDHEEAFCLLFHNKLLIRNSRAWEKNVKEATIIRYSLEKKLFRTSCKAQKAILESCLLCLLLVREGEELFHRSGQLSVQKLYSWDRRVRLWTRQLHLLSLPFVNCSTLQVCPKILFYFDSNGYQKWLFQTINWLFCKEKLSYRKKSCLVTLLLLNYSLPFQKMMYDERKDIKESKNI